MQPLVHIGPSMTRQRSVVAMKATNSWAIPVLMPSDGRLKFPNTSSFGDSIARQTPTVQKGAIMDSWEDNTPAAILTVPLSSLSTKSLKSASVNLYGLTDDNSHCPLFTGISAATKPKIGWVQEGTSASKPSNSCLVFERGLIVLHCQLQ